MGSQNFRRRKSKRIKKRGTLFLSSDEIMARSQIVKKMKPGSSLHSLNAAPWLI